jgi:hypothetical protein
MKNISKILIFCTFCASLLNVFDNDAKQNLYISYCNESYSSASLSQCNPITDDSVYDVSLEDNCFDEYIITDSHYSGYLKSNLFFIFQNTSQQKVNDKIWRPPQQS